MQFANRHEDIFDVQQTRWLICSDSINNMQIDGIGTFFILVLTMEGLLLA